MASKLVEFPVVVSQIPALDLAGKMKSNPKSFKLVSYGKHALIVWKRRPRPREWVALEGCAERSAIFVKTTATGCICVLRSGETIQIPRTAILGVVAEVRLCPPTLFAA